MEVISKKYHQFIFYPAESKANALMQIAEKGDRHSESFNSQNIVDISALCLHILTRLAKIQSQSSEFNSLYSYLKPLRG